MDINDVKLNEAEATDPNEILTPDGKGLPDTADDKRWNTIYLDLISKNNKIDYYTISIDGFERKAPISGETSSGYIKFKGKTGETETKKKLFFFGGKTVDSLDLSEVEIVDNENDASIFTADDVKVVIQALKSNKDLKSYKSITTKKSSIATINSDDVILKYFDKLAGDGKSNSIRSAISSLDTICRRRKDPLVGNALFDIFKSIINANPGFVFNNSITITINNIVADRVLRSSDIINPNNFLCALMYNKTLYEVNGHTRGVKDITDLFSLYEKAKSLRSSEINIPGLKEYKILQIAKQILLKIDDSDLFTAIVNGADVKDEKLVEIGYKPEGNILTGTVREIEEAQSLFNKIFETLDREEDESSRSFKYFLQVIQGSTVTSEDLKIINDEEGNTEGRFENISLLKDSFVRVVRTTADNASDKDLGDLIPTLGADYFKGSELFIFEDGKLKVKKDVSTSIDIEVVSINSRGRTTYKLREFKPSDLTIKVDTTPEEETEETKPEEETKTPDVIDKTGLVETEPVGTLEGDVLKDVAVDIGDVVTGLDGKEYQVTAENVGDGKWDIKAGTKIYQKPVDLNHLSSGNSLADILTSRDAFRAAYSSLSNREKNKLKSIVNPSWLPSRK